jgi:ATP-dependent Clp protease ATP-binding subunit ClpA
MHGPDQHLLPCHRGELRCVGCTTLDKFRKFIEKDPALERRFQQVQVSSVLGGE